MSWWGKVIGGYFGFMIGGPIGALLGVAAGNYFDKGLDGIDADESLSLGTTERVQSAFFAASFATMGYIAKSDGRVTRDEIAMAEQVMSQMRLNAQQREVARRLFNEGKQPGFSVHEVLTQFKRECHRRRSLIQMFLEIIVATACADGNLHAKEQVILEEIAADLGYTHQQFADLLSRVTGQSHFAKQDSTKSKLTVAYELLGITESASDAEVKKAYRRQMNQHHPDKLVAKGLPEEMIEIANRKTQDIKAAYELIKSQRA